MEYDALLDCWICVTRIPYHVKGLVREDAEGTNVMLISESLSDKCKKETYEHEKKHIERGDLHSEDDISTIEKE